jgi:Family of unknown function (DUF6188)
MYGLPSNTNLDFLKGATLIQVCFGENDLILNFSDSVSIAIFSSVGVGVASSAMNKHSTFQEVAGELLALLNKVVSNVRWTPEGTITLELDNGNAIQIYDDSPSFESYTISSSLGLLVV